MAASTSTQICGRRTLVIAVARQIRAGGIVVRDGQFLSQAGKVLPACASIYYV
jgi:hypothetical protein